MSRLASEIRRIARGDKLKGPLSGTLERDPIGGTFVPFSNTPLSQITANGAGGTDPVNINSVGSDGSAADPTDTSNQNDQPPNVNDPNSFNKGSATQGSTANTYDIEDVIDQTGDAPSSPNEPDYTDSGEQSTGGIIDRLNGATDCSTGQCINFHTDGNFPAPEGWDDSDTPPVDPDYVEGEYWRMSGGSYPLAGGGTYTYGSYNAQTQGAAIGYVYGNEHPAAYAEMQAVVPGALAYRTIEVDNGSQYQIAVQYRVGTEWSTFESFVINLRDCSTNYAAVCDLDPPLSTAWPEDGCYDLALIDGSFTTNQYDSEAPSGAGGSVANFCFGTGRQGAIESTANGGFMVYETSGGAPTGTVSVYGADGTFQAAGDSTPQFMDQWRPK